MNGNIAKHGRWRKCECCGRENPIQGTRVLGGYLCGPCTAYLEEREKDINKQLAHDPEKRTVRLVESVDADHVPCYIPAGEILKQGGEVPLYRKLVEGIGVDPDDAARLVDGDVLWMDRPLWKACAQSPHYVTVRMDEAKYSLATQQRVRACIRRQRSVSTQ